MRFVLVHGGMHGGWCWDKLVPELEALGHTAIAPDLPGHGERRSEDATLDGYRAAVVDLVEPGDVLVGHSMGGTPITLAADVVPEKIRHLVYLAAPVPLPLPGKSIADCVPQYVVLPGVAYNEKEFWVEDLAGAINLYYHDCEKADQKWAFDRLQPQAQLPIVSPIKLDSFWTSSIPRSYVACMDDRTSASIIVRENLQRLGLRVAYPMWASHSPFLSRPKDLARLLVDIVEHPVAATPDVELIRSVTA